MTINHIDQLAQWYADAEQVTKTNLPRIGDSLILPYDEGGFGIEVAVHDWTPDDVGEGESVRIDARAPKPKPAWHDASAVIATFRDDCGMVTGVWVPEGMPDYWEGPEGDVVAASALENVTPLIEAKVSDEMVDRAWAASKRWEFGGVSKPAARAILAAALGVEAE